MEEEDELMPEPDEKGQLILSNRAWVHLDPHIWTLAYKLIKLDISYNHIVEIPKQIGEMVMLRELIASFNKLTSLPIELGNLKRLRKLHVNSNRLKIIPPEFGNLEMLEELIVGENMIEEIPISLSRLSNLRILRITNNRLKSIPFEMADILTLEEFDCGNNPNLDSIPAKWRGDTESVIFTCKVHRDYSIRMIELDESNQELGKHSQILEQDNLILKERTLELQSKIDDLIKNMPKKYARRMEKAAQLAKEKEMQIDDDKDKGFGRCSIS